jgi:hypothetical protein
LISILGICTPPAFPLISRAPTGILLRPEDSRGFSLSRSVSRLLSLLFLNCRGIALPVTCL